ncbi:MAG: glycosyltransferase [Bacteroidetes bacterium]|nr:glycosyltransferase [Bacteroidota bacterium]
MKGQGVMNNPKISIIVPSFNQGAYIEHTILSVLKQDYSNWELIIQDACSTDQTAEICAAYVLKDKRIQFYREKDKGFADGVNKALDHASGEICGIQSSDDYYSEAGVFTQVAKMYSENPQLNLLTAYHVPIDNQTSRSIMPPSCSKRRKWFSGSQECICFEESFSTGIHIFLITTGLAG